ncbi:hypothetical protein Poli38472_007780 [Pythium oligandrum]|uniref:Uncharacterized protein n=1 Tax=Pythium oligandrum TaxID=41045 RepID=A0A8K1CTQ2_PYTOL|nr:hypothetical protein Poli38472_007780 [Pythium oligandrum]|eukprot:TMW68108.1 hypothetical protein Poli38472_007780 [Pythium oligandrum]
MTKPETQRWSTRKAVGVAAVAAAGVCAGAFGLFARHADHFQHNATRLLTAMAEADAIEITLTPREGSTLAPGDMQMRAIVVPRGSEGDFDGRLSYVNVDRQYNFTLVDGRGYVTVENAETGKLINADCLYPRNIPPIHTLYDVLADARVIDPEDADDEFTIMCDSGKAVEFMFAGEPFIFCTKDDTAEEDVKTIRGRDLTATLNFLRDNSDKVESGVSLAAPSYIDISKCEVLDSDDDDDDDDNNDEEDNQTRSLRALMASHYSAVSTRVKDAVSVVTGQPRRSLAATQEADCTCRDGKKPCLFVHGLGKGLFGNDTGIYNEFDEYWPDMDKNAKCCSSVKFVRMDTMRNAWFDDVLAKQVCDAAVELTNSTDKMALQNIALVAHSMGNLIISNAAMKGFCAIDPATSKWISLTAPMLGSQAANLAIDICGREDDVNSDSATEATTMNVTVAPAANPLVGAMELVGLCPMVRAVSKLAFYRSKYSNATEDKLWEAAVEYSRDTVTSQLCGVSPLGLSSIYSVSFGTVGAAAKHASKENDGVVDFASCAAGREESEFGTHWKTSTFYKARLNHADGHFKSGDGWWGDDRKPLKWFNCQF